MKVLSILPFGETVDVLRHYLPTEPFFYENGLQSSDLALLDVVPLHLTPGVGKVAMDDKSAPRLLKVPRQVRDYVLSLTTDEEKWES